LKPWGGGGTLWNLGTRIISTSARCLFELHSAHANTPPCFVQPLLVAFTYAFPSISPAAFSHLLKFSSNHKSTHPFCPLTWLTFWTATRPALGRAFWCKPGKLRVLQFFYPSKQQAFPLVVFTTGLLPRPIPPSPTDSACQCPPHPPFP
jgi:hypothetical protein